MSDCLFCQIVQRKIPAEIVFENEQVIGFKDINPSAKIHLLFIHKHHSTNVNDMLRSDHQQIHDIFAAINEYTMQVGLEQEGYRIVTNIGKNGGQVVLHTHFHLLGGERLSGNFGA